MIFLNCAAHVNNLNKKGGKVRLHPLFNFNLENLRSPYTVTFFGSLTLDDFVHLNFKTKSIVHPLKAKSLIFTLESLPILIYSDWSVEKQLTANSSNTI